METIEIKQIFLTETIERIITSNDKLEPLIDFSRFSNLNELLFTYICILNAVDRMRKQIHDDIIQKSKAAIVCIKISQYQSITDGINFLRAKKVLSNRSTI